MGRGLGATQRAMLDHLDTLAPPWTTVADIAEALERSPRQVLATVRSLEARELVRTERAELRFEMTGQLVARPMSRGGLPPGEPVVVKAGDPWPYRPGYVATADTTFYPTVRAVHGLRVSSVKGQRRWARMSVEQRRRELRRRPGDGPPR